MSLRSDCLLAVTGIFPTVITPRQHVASLAIEQAWQKRLTRWINGEQQPFTYVPPKDLEVIWNQLALEPDQIQVSAWLEGVGHEVPEEQADFYTGLRHARSYLVDAWPKFHLMTQAGPKILPLSHDDAHEVWSLIQVLDDPDRMLEEMEARTLTPTQAVAFSEVYPDLYAYANEVLATAISTRLAKDPMWAPGWEWEAVLRTFRGQAPEALPPPPPPAPKPDGDFKIDANREQTQADVSAAPKGPNQRTSGK